MARSMVTITTRDGRCGSYLFKPDTARPCPAVLVYMDGRGIRPALFELAERIAAAGYVVLLPDLFYRAGPYRAPDAATFSANAELRKNWQLKFMSTATKANIKADTERFLAFLAELPEVGSRSVGTTGYCMGGSLSLAAAGHFPDRVVAAASYHGGNLATEAADSPHRLASRMKARIYVAGAVEDPSFPDEQKELLTESFRAAGVDSLVETYAGAKHGWVPSDSVVYDQAASERHYQTLLTLFDAKLRAAAPDG